VQDAILAASTTGAPSKIGPYRVLRTLGHGGMGSVYLGEHEDSDLDRRVALKVLRTARHDPDLLRRFRNERRILGALQHANIATLYEAGSTEDGQPYVAMEFVDGKDLMSHAEAEKLDMHARLRLFVKVCRAVAHAHRALVVHRDLKPSNVLVTTTGEPKLLDFGIAKLLDAPDDETAVVTRTGHVMLTPEYSSPEQVRSEAITTSTDVYALGVLLYELLTGQRAQPHAGTSMQELLSVVCERTPPAASSAVRRGAITVPGRPESRTRWSRQLEGDLDTILTTAMQKEPARRYQSAAALAEDLEHHLRGLPVQARPDTLMYHTQVCAS
jgi:eukaryotic-like serine/threonine-protein kinase